MFLGRDFSSGKNYSEETAAAIDGEIRNIIGNAYKTCKKILTENIDKLHFIAEYLLKCEFMDEEQFRAAMEMENPTIEDIEKIADEKKKKSDEENKKAYEERLKEEAEARERAEAMREEMLRSESAKRDADNGLLTDDFFRTVWKAPANEEPQNDEPFENEAEKTESDTTVEDSETADNSNESADKKEE